MTGTVKWGRDIPAKQDKREAQENVTRLENDIGEAASPHAFTKQLFSGRADKRCATASYTLSSVGRRRLGVGRISQSEWNITRYRNDIDRTRTERYAPGGRQ